ncbi:syntaxin-binding protein 5 isoform X4 [Octopus bimaculoides]|uniref:syntaxin-binding protein 5 isoform X4 n=1 Tax=Octopus bimaculoides TaxID=37653 RepID=UPI0022E09D07|nr:syntaxin-binding protein 5 isoform X4 [Octopus bimaculoides]
MSTVMDKMKKFKIKGVLDGLRSSVNTPAKTELDITETLRSEHFEICKTVRHGFPFQPTALAYDPVQHILAIGTKSGSLRIFGRPGVDCHCCHPEEAAVIQILFLINEGALVTVCSDDTLHLWNYRQKRPDIVHTLKFMKERITYCHLPFQSKWFYIGTERGNVHIVNIETFSLSGYVINWNKAIELSRKTHPGPVVHLEDNPIDPSRLLIGFESGAVVVWDLKNKTAELRFSTPEALRSLSWWSDGKQFMGSHSDGSLTTWNLKTNLKATNITMPHAKPGKDGKLEPCKPIKKIEWKSVRGGEPLIIFSGGMPYDKVGRTPSITVMNGKSITVLEMEHNIVDFVVLCETPWQNDFQVPYAIVVLLQNDLVVVDLTVQGYPCFENPYPMDIHESPVTACQYYADCPPDLIPAFYSVGSKQKKTGFSENGWPIKGGEWGTTTCSYPEIILTGHADGSVKFWDASAVTLQVLCKVKSAKLFEKPKCKNSDGSDDDPFAIQMMQLCRESRLLCVAGATHVMLFRFDKQESQHEVVALEIQIIYEVYDDLDSPDYEYSRPFLGAVHQQQSGSLGSYSSSASDSTKYVQEKKPPLSWSGAISLEYSTALKVKPSQRRWNPGFQPDIVCLLAWIDNEHPGNVTSICVNSSYGLMAFGNESGLAVVDIIQKICLLNIGTPDLYGSMDPYQRAPRSPRGKRPQPLDANNTGQIFTDECKSPTSDQIEAASPSPSPKQKKQHPHPELKRTKSQAASRKIQKAQSNASLEDNNGGDKNDGSSFSRSRSSSMSSLENVSKEAIQCLKFSDSYTRKTDSYTCPCLWVGTSLGSVLVIVLNLPSQEQRNFQPVIVSPSGTIFRLKGAILTMSFLDCNGVLVPDASVQWEDKSKLKIDPRDAQAQKTNAGINYKKVSPTTVLEVSDRQFAIICSEKQARVMSLPSQTCAYKVKITETSFVVKSEIVSIKDSVCLACYVANGRIVTFSLPSLKPLMDAPFQPLTEIRVARTFCFSNNGHAMYLCTPTELQKVTYSAEMRQNLNEMLGDLFLPCETPEAPKQGFFKNLFGGGSVTVDREELFGETSGKAAKGMAKFIAGSGGMHHLTAQSTSVGGEVARTKQLFHERGEKLEGLEDRTQQMTAQAESYSQVAHQLMLKYKDKKWYQF